jgi:DNA-binding PadR family transcriptional regulator
MEGRILAPLFDLTEPDFRPVTVSDLRPRLKPRDYKGIAPRLRELHLKGYIEASKIDGRRYFVLSDLGRRAVELYGDAMRAAEPPVPKHAQ